MLCIPFEYCNHGMSSTSDRIPDSLRSPACPSGAVRLNADCHIPEVAVDTGKTKPSILPTITIEDVDKAGARTNGQAQPHPPETPTTPTWPASPTTPTSPDGPEPPGAMPPGPAPEIPDWYKVGWRDVSGIDRQKVAEGEEKDKELLSLFLSEQFYGEWYHNAALVVVVRT